MRIGKLGNGLPESLILKKFKPRKEVLEQPKIGADWQGCGLMTVLQCYQPTPLLQQHSPSYLTVHVNCNDAAAAGAEPIGLLVTLLAPPETEQYELERIAGDIQEAASAINVNIIGGHTEITSAVTRIITSSTVIAQPVAKPISNTADIGDYIIMTKTAGIEGTALIAYDLEHKLTDLSQEELQQAKDMLKEISVVKEGIFAAKNGATLMHDVTEGRHIGRYLGSSLQCRQGRRSIYNEIDIHPVTKKICSMLNIDPYRLLSKAAVCL